MGINEAYEHAIHEEPVNSELNALCAALRDIEQSGCGDVRACRGAIADYLDERDDPNAAEHRLWLALDDIRHEPNNDALRLAWADILERYNVGPYTKARAEFVRVQVAIAQQSRGLMPPSPWNDRTQDELERRERVLFDGYDDLEGMPHVRMWAAWPINEWGHQLPRHIATSPNHVVWRRGWPAEACTNWTNWRNRGDTILQSVPGLDRVTITDRPVYDANDGVGFVGGQHALRLIVAGKRLVFPIPRRAQAIEKYSYPTIKDVLALRWPDVRSWSVPGERVITDNNPERGLR